MEYPYIDINYVYYLVNVVSKVEYAQSIPKRDFFVTHREVGEMVDGLEIISQLIPQSIAFKADRRLELENRVTALEEHLKEFENMCLDQKAQIADLKGLLAESNKSIKEYWQKISFDGIWGIIHIHHNICSLHVPKLRSICIIFCNRN